MQIKSWTEIATPHEDVLKGTFKQAEFAADISRVRAREAGPEYDDPVKFFERTFITEGMRLLMDSLVKRLNGQGGDPVIQLQTAFGGSKTHTLIAVYHLAGGEVPTSSLQGVPPILDAAGISDLPRATIAVIDGNRISPSQPQRRGSLEVRTLWGEIAWQIGGESGFALVADADRDGTSPGKEVLARLLSRHAPVVILVDELVAYVRQLEEGKSYPGGTLDSNLSFIQALTETLAGTSNCTLLVSLPESTTELGSIMGQRALDSLEKYFGRIHALWKPVAIEEAFEIVRRRLFNPITDQQDVEAVCQAFSRYYQENSGDFPTEALDGAYYRRLVASYPIHPEVFDRLYLDWSSLDKFQRTRGVLQLMATVIYRLWKDGSRDPMIMPGALPLYDNNVRNQSIYYLPQGWDPVIDKDIDSEQAETARIDTQNPLIGKYQGARRTARAIFLGSAPSARGQRIRGITANRISLGAAFPGMHVGVIRDALKKLSDKLHYLNLDDDRYWFDVTPNLRREMEERKKRFDYDEILPEVRSRMGRVVNKGCFGGVHVFTPSADIPDDLDLRLCVLPPRAGHSKACNDAVKAAEAILKMRGSSPRLHQNRLIFLVPDASSVGRLMDHVRTFLAWKSIISDVEQSKLVLDVLQVKQAQSALESISSTVNRTISECYQWLLCPVQQPGRNGGVGKIEWESVRLGTGAANMGAEIEKRLVDEEMLLKVWSPIHLDQMLRQWFWKEGVTELNTQDLWRKMCDYLYLPRLQNSAILTAVIASGTASGDYFGYADGKEGDDYKGFKFQEPATCVIDASALIIEIEAARSYKAGKTVIIPPDRPEKPEGEPEDEPGDDPEGEGEKGRTEKEKEQPGKDNGKKPVVQPPRSTRKKRFYATTTLDPHAGRIAYDEIQKEVLNLLSTPGATMRIRLDIEVESPEGYDESTQRAVRENCGTLNFKQAEFDEE